MTISSLLLLIATQSQFTVTNATYDGRVERPKGARLVWTDEFNGSSLDLAKWEFDTARNKGMPQTDHVLIEVSDTGQGIPPDIIELCMNDPILKALLAEEAKENAEENQSSAALEKPDAVEQDEDADDEPISSVERLRGT